MGAIYFVDTNEWINLSKLYPKDVFSSLWDNIENLIAEERILAPKEVRDEIERGHDELVEWCKTHQKMFRSRLIKQVKKIIDEHPTLVDPNAPHESADPYIIVHITGLSPIIVTDENHAFHMSPELMVYKHASWWRCFKRRDGSSRGVEITSGLPPAYVTFLC